MGRPLRSLVYDFAFNSILPFLVKFRIFVTKSRNQCELGFLDVFLNIYMFCSRQWQIRLLSINTDVLSNFLLVDSSFILLVNSRKFSFCFIKRVSCVLSLGFRDIINQKKNKTIVKDKLCMISLTYNAMCNIFFRFY